MKFGLNLYSIRNYLDTEENFLTAAKQLKQMGYSYMQFSGAPLDAGMVARVSAASGLDVVLTHVPMDRILNDTDALMQEHASFGCKYIGLGSMPKDVIYDKARCFETVAALDEAGARMEEKGFKFFYHHHHFEFYRHNGETVWDYILKNAPHINFTLDTYWLQYGGVDICDVIDRAAGRIECVHLKDYMIAYKEGDKPNFEPRFAPVGDGNIDFGKVMKHAAAAGCKYYLVEQDNAAKLPDPMEQVERSIRYLNANFN
ncbi:MAG: sugar phosphate isomerase/epimerase [Clostridia bacterium]|nr:sugar phosphate isomerase/epimerase [Clostridia bacterium]